jgi:hypothetical protein
VAETEPLAPPFRKPRWLQFSLRALLAAMLLGGVLLGRYGIRRLEIARERDALAELQRFGADVQFHDQRVVGISFSGPRFRNPALDRVGRFPRLRRLVFIDTALNDAGLARLTQLEDLRQLLVIDAAVTDRGLAHVGRLEHLETLRLDNTQITDDGLIHLASLKNLERLELAGTRVSDRGLQRLEGLSGLESLYLRETQVTDEGVQSLQRKLPKTTVVR